MWPTHICISRVVRTLKHLSLVFSKSISLLKLVPRSSPSKEASLSSPQKLRLAYTKANVQPHATLTPS